MKGKGNENFKELRNLELALADTQRRLKAETDSRAALANTVKTLVQKQISQPPSPSANQLWNGELGHSVNSWHDSAYVTTDTAKECAWFFSHDAPAPSQTLSLTDARTNSTNNTLKTKGYGAIPAHSTYSADYSDWDGSRGAARIQGTKTIDTPLPLNSVEAEMTTYVNFIAAKRNQYIEIPETLRLFCGLWDNTSGQRDWLKGSVGLSATPSEAGGATELRYRLFIETDRGYSILSPEVTILDGWSDAEFAAGKKVNLQWNNAAGYLRITIWRYKPSTGTYLVLQEISSGASTYIDNNASLRTATGYPIGTENERKALFFTTTGNLVPLATEGSAWDTIHCKIGVPNNYDKSLTTDRQWLRIGLTEACNLFVTGVTTEGSITIYAPNPVFESDYAAQFIGLTVEIYDENDVLILTTTVDTYSDDVTLRLADAVDAGTNRKIRVVGAGFHGILIDKIHLGFQDNVSFAPNALDARTLNPVAAPSSGQGGVGTGNPPSGGGLCCVIDTPIKLGGYSEEPDEKIQNLAYGRYVSGENSAPNTVIDVVSGFARTRVVRTKNGIEKECTNDHRFKVSVWDTTGVPLYQLKVGDKVFTDLDGKDELSEIVYISPLSYDKKAVYTPRLQGGCYYKAGTWKPNFWQKILIKLGLMKPKKGEIYAHNQKPSGEILV